MAHVKGQVLGTVIIFPDFQVVATVPELISVIDAQNSEALSAPQYLFVIVIGITGKRLKTNLHEIKHGYK
jgi:hypothetical protein